MYKIAIVLLSFILLVMPGILSAADNDAYIFVLEGPVKVVTSAGNAADAQAGGAIHKGDKVQTGANGSVIIMTRDNASFTLEKSTMVKVMELGFNKKKTGDTVTLIKNVKLKLMKGNIRSRTATVAKGSSFVVETTFARCVVYGGIFYLKHDKGTLLTVDTGTVDVYQLTPDGEETKLDEKDQIFIHPPQAPAVKQVSDPEMDVLRKEFELPFPGLQPKQKMGKPVFVSQNYSFISSGADGDEYEYTLVAKNVSPEATVSLVILDGQQQEINTIDMERTGSDADIATYNVHVVLDGGKQYGHKFIIDTE